MTNCPKCEIPLRPNAEFCVGCGYSLQTGTLPQDVLPTEGIAAQVNAQVSEVRQIGVLFALILLSSLVVGWASRWGDSLMLEVYATAFDAIVILAFCYRYRRIVIPLLTFPKIGWLQSFNLLAMSVIFIVAMDAYFSLIQSLGVPMAQLSSNLVKHGWNPFEMLLLVSIAPALFEELAFRGVIQTHLQNLLSQRDAWIIQAALFSVLHLSPLIFPSHFVMGLYFGWLRRKSGSLYPGMALHATWNALVLFQ